MTSTESAPRIRKTDDEKIASMTKRFLESTRMAGPFDCWINERKHMMAHTGQLWAPHKVSYFIYKGLPPNGAKLQRICKNIFCVNPEHIKTQVEIFQDEGREKGYVVMEEQRWKIAPERMAELVIEDLLANEMIPPVKMSGRKALVKEVTRVLDANGIIVMREDAEMQDETSDEDDENAPAAD